MDINLRIAGEAGQGLDTTGNVLVGALAALGLYVFSSQNYMSRIRGGLNWYDIRIGDAELFSGRQKADLLVALTAEALGALRGDVTRGGVILFDGTAEPDVVPLEFTKIAKEVGGAAIMANSVAAGAVFGLLGYEVDALCVHVAQTLKTKGEEIVQNNLKCVRRGFELATPHAGVLKAPKPADAPSSIYSGSEAVAVAAATAGVKFVTAYPMSPSTATFTFLASLADEYGIVVEQAEDEIAAINMVCGATYAGVPAMTTTSGGGFALMCEGLSLAGVMELPVVIMLAQRPGPATGLPTKTAQEDLRFALHGGHGEFPRAVFAPGTPHQAAVLTRRALETAQKYQTPVILLTDHFLADLQRNSPPLDRAPKPIDRHILTDPPEDYLPYTITPDGVSPRALPGSAGYVVCDSHEHTEDGHITEDRGVRTRMQDKRMAKERGMTAEALPPELYGPHNAEHLLVAWGSTYGPCHEAMDILNARGAPVAMLHFAQVWPIHVTAARAILGQPGSKKKHITCVEANSTGQFASVLRELGALTDCDLLLKYDGSPFTGEEIASRSVQ